MTDFLLLPHAHLDDSAGRIVPGGWVFVRNGRVEGRGEGTPPSLGEPLPTLRGGFLTEPLCDAHVHLFLGGSFDPAERKQLAGMARDQALERILNLLEHYRRLGIFAVRDGGDPLGLALEALWIAAKEPGRYAQVLASGEPLFRKGKYGGFLGRGIETQEDGFRLIDENARAGARQIKILATGINSLDTPGATGGFQFTPQEIAALAAHSEAAGLPLMVHANGPLGDLPKIMQGTVEHAFWLDPEDLMSMRKHNVSWTPTCEAWAALADHPALTSAQLDTVAQTAKRHDLEVAWGVEAGVNLLPGSDAGTPGVPHDVGFYRELTRLAKTGVPWGALLSNSIRFSAPHRQKRGLGVGDAAEFVIFPSVPTHSNTLDRPVAVYSANIWSGKILPTVSNP